METIIPIISVILFLGFLANRLNKKDNSEEELNQQYDDIVNSMYESANDSDEQTQQDTIDSMKQEQNQPDTLGLMFRTLSNLGCQPTKNEDGTLSVSYQGENFHMEFGGMYARVWDPMWAGVKADDPDMPKIREAVNAANFNFGPTVVLTAPNDEGVIGFHSRRDIMLHPLVLTMYPLSKPYSIHFSMQKSKCATVFNKSTPNRWSLKRIAVR